MSTGRPRASSREAIAEAACELFLERGYDATSVVEIAARAGVSRSSFFNYFDSKADVLWAGLDERIGGLEESLAASDGRTARDAVREVAAGFAPDSLALAIVNAPQMRVDDELERESAIRLARIARAVAVRLRSDGVPSLSADVCGAAYGGAVLAAITEWAQTGASRRTLLDVLAPAIAMIGALDTTAAPDPG